MAQIRNLKDNGGNVFYPLTHERAVKDSNGVSLESKLAGLESKSYIEAWDGASTPVVANIPAGVTVTYNSTTYTGTLAASESTIGKIYLVKNGNNYDRYITSQSGSSYSWASNGSTEMDLSGYATDEELGQLQQEVNNKKYSFTNGTAGSWINESGSQRGGWVSGYISDYIRVKSGQKVKNYCAAGTDALVIAFYDDNKSFVNSGKVLGQNASAIQSYTSAAPQDGYVRFYTDKNRVASAWEDSYFLLESAPVREIDIASDYSSPDVSPMALSLGKGLKAAEDTKLAIPVISKNLFDPSRVISGHIITASGVEDTTSGNYSCTPFILVKPNTDYCFSSLGRYIMPQGEVIVAFYNDKGGFISSSIMQSDSPSATFTTPNGCAYIRLNLSSLYGLNETQLEEGDARTTYERYKVGFNELQSATIGDFNESLFEKHITGGELLTKSGVVKEALDVQGKNIANAALREFGRYSTKCFKTENYIAYLLVGGVSLLEGETYRIRLSSKEQWSGGSFYLYMQNWTEDGSRMYNEVRIITFANNQTEEYIQVPTSNMPNVKFVLFGSPYEGELTFEITKDVELSELYFNKSNVKLAEKNRFNAEWMKYIFGCKIKELTSFTNPYGYWETQNAYKRLSLLCFTDSHIDYYPFTNSGDKYSLENVEDVINCANHSTIVNKALYVNTDKSNGFLAVDGIVHMGDIVTTGGVRTKEFEKAKQKMFFDIVKKSKVPFLYSKGNHDCNDMTNDPGTAFNDDDWQDIWYGYAESQYGIVRQTKANGKKSTWHYRDFDEYKVRVVVLDGQDTNKNIAVPSDDALYGSATKIMYDGSNGFYISQEQFSWIANVALNFDDKEEKDWAVIFAVHQFYADDGVSRHSEKYRYEASTPKLFDMCVAFNNGGSYSQHYSFDPNNTESTDVEINPYAFFNLNIDADFSRYASLEKKPKVVMWLIGHEHIDWSEDDRGIKKVWVMQGMASSASGDMRVQRIPGTASQNAFDMILVDNVERTIRFIRYGAGENCFGRGGDRFMPEGFSY